MSRSKQSSDDQSELDTDNETVVDKDENSALNIRRSIVKWLKKSSNFVNLYSTYFDNYRNEQTRAA